MTPRALTIALIASTTLNVFAVAGAAALFVSHARVEREVAAQNRPARGVGLMAVVDGLPDDVRDRVRQGLRDAALAARPDFEQSRTSRRQAQELASAETFDDAQVTRLLAQSREAEMRGRAHLETRAVALLKDLDAGERAAVAPFVLSRHQRAPRRDDRRPEGPGMPPPDGPPDGPPGPPPPPED